MAKIHEIPKKKECPSCAFEVDSNETHCTICNYEFPQGLNLDWKKLTAIFLLLVFIVFIFRLL
ncbi:MAG: hypothetical protein DWQ06_16025 [Calditrichaeota bacterium]|nr:MAG: hypothetical protein DWQ06_16025 [Calditrichota bacterium]